MGAYKYKQLIIIRKDLKMNKGKLAAQACHASVGALLKCTSTHNNQLTLDFNKYPEIKEWLDNSFAKVALAVNSEDELKRCYDMAIENNIPASYIEDNGTTVFHGVKTATCVGVGPCDSEKLDSLFGELKLY